ncbi:MAG: CoA-binding protein, partial [Chthoniobacterales bacterium]
MSKSAPDSATHSLPRTRPRLDVMFAPKSVALIGATDSPNSVGRALMENLCTFPGKFFPINPNRPSVLDRKTWPGISEVPEPVDLAVIATKAATIPGIVRDCAAAGVKGAIIISAGFKEIGERGRELEKQVAAARGAMRIIGPNCVGVMLPHL